MTILTDAFTRDCTNSLGIPVDNFTLTEAVERIVTLARIKDGKSRLVSTLNVDFLVNALGYGFSEPRHPELLRVLRESEIVTADGFPIVWLSKIVGKPIKARVAGSDLVPALAKRIAGEELSLFLLGGGEGSAATAAQVLKANSPGLTIAGSAAPYIHTEGPNVEKFSAEDHALVEEINASGASILLMGLGNPKQELWFDRNKERLNVPIAIGVGGTFEFIMGKVRRAPKFLQKLNLEWCYRITQDPKRLIGRYAKGLVNLFVLATPLLYYWLKESFLYRQTPNRPSTDIHWQSVWSSRSESLQILRLPKIVTPGYLAKLIDQLRENETNTGTRLLDFSQVKHICAAGHHELFRLAEILDRNPGSFSLLGLNKSVKRHLQACRVLDLLGQTQQGNNALSAISYVDQQAAPATEIGCNSYTMNATTLIFLSGRVDGHSLDGLGLIECMQHAARERTCIIDLRNVTLLEPTAITKLQTLINEVLKQGSGAIMVSGASEDITQMFQATGLDNNLIAMDDATLLAYIASEGIDHDN